ncbi:MAG: hypothetical protein KAI43_04305 [Candidatus Aureabacteria bacterium]|nr:hypothetical protein [Candidatus Auribacterota bacterium]
MFDIKKIVVFLLVGMFCFSLYAEEAEYPEDLAAIVKQFPESTVISSAKTKQDINAILSAEGKQAKEVMDYYKSSLTTAEWEIVTEMDHGNVKALEFKKDDQELIVTFMCMPEGVMITLALTIGTDDDDDDDE